MAVMLDLGLVSALALVWIVTWCIVWVLSSTDLSPAASRVTAAQALWRRASLYLLFSKDKSWSPNVWGDAARADLNDPNLKIKTLVLIRHGESVWNQVFNQGFGPGFLVRLVYAVLCEFYVMTMGDSLFIDSPLSRRGERQADALHSFLRTQGDPDDAFQGRKPASASAYIARSASIARQVHHGDHDSCIVSSNLRRSMGTAVLALRSRLVQKNEKILILSSLQEISRNVDTVSMAGPRAVQPSLGGTLQGLNTDKLFDAEMNAGTKVAETRGCKRIQTFVEWTFSQPKSRIIVSGHSLYFKELFKLYLPRASDHRAKKRKIANGGMVSCDIAMDSNGIVQILPNSITPVYLGFA